MHLKALQDRLTALMGEADAIVAKAERTADDVARIKAIPAEMAEVKAQIEAAREIESIRSWQQQTAPTDITLVGGAGGTTEAGATRTADAPKPDTDLAVKAWYTSRFKSVPAGAEQIAKELYGDFGNGSYEQLVFDKHQAFVRYVRTGDMGLTPDERRISKAIVLTPNQIIAAAAAGISVRSIKATMVEGVDTLGGFLVPEDFRETLIERLPGLTVVRAGADVQTTSSDILTMVRVTGGSSRYTGNVRWTLVNEVPIGTEAATNATFGELRIPVYTVMGHIAISKNTLEDSMTNLVGYLSDELSSSSAIYEDELFLVGPAGGVAGPEGMLVGTAANGDPLNADLLANRVASGAASTLTGDGVKKVPFAIAKQYRVNNAVWIMNKATLQAVSLLKDGNGQYLVGGGPEGRMNAAGIPTSLLGYGIEESEAMPDIAANTWPIIFGDRRGYTIADRVGMSIERYDDSTTAKSNSVVIVARRRFGGQVTQGWRLAAQKVAAS